MGRPRASASSRPWGGARDASSYRFSSPLRAPEKTEARAQAAVVREEERSARGFPPISEVAGVVAPAGPGPVAGGAAAVPPRFLDGEWMAVVPGGNLGLGQAVDVPSAAAVSGDLALFDVDGSPAVARSLGSAAVPAYLSQLAKDTAQARAMLTPAGGADGVGEQSASGDAAQAAADAAAVGSRLSRWRRTLARCRSATSVPPVRGSGVVHDAGLAADWAPARAGRSSQAAPGARRFRSS